MGEFVSRACRRPIVGAIFALAALASGCGPYVGTCSWIVPEADGAIEVVAPRRPISGECNCIGCKAPGEFVLRREAYVIEFWNGDRWYPQLFVRARTPEGVPLAIRSLKLTENRPVTPLPDQYMEFDYFTGVPLVAGKAPASGPMGVLNLEILDDSGRVLGTEPVEIELITKRDLMFIME